MLVEVIINYFNGYLAIRPPKLGETDFGAEFLFPILRGEDVFQSVLDLATPDTGGRLLTHHGQLVHLREKVKLELVISGRAGLLWVCWVLDRFGFFGVAGVLRGFIVIDRRILLDKLLSEISKIWRLVAGLRRILRGW